MDYLAAWREAAEAADAVNQAAGACGIEDEVRAVPHAGAQGEPVVWMRPEGANALAAVLIAWARGSGEG
ncbi:hypothetical protein [Streptomyces sp. NPDC059063]|uniref:hypothetical protein n=1 Tax=unclassified Streptomyces TaxID=2593676 RepID=UPI0036BA9439